MAPQRQDRGRLVQLDRPRDLYEHPKTRFAAAFIGLMNFFDGEVAADGLAVPGLTTLKGEVPNGLEIGAKASLAVRPERLRLARDQDAAAANCLAGEVVDIAYHGQDVGVHVGITGLPRPLLVRLPCGDEIAAGLAPGEPIYCHWEARHSRLLAD